MSAKWTKRRIEIPPEFGPNEREAIGEEILNFIRKRTDSGRGVGGEKFPGYSSSYTKSLDFKNAGKSKRKVDLKLSGDMLAAIDVLSHKKGSILYGFENGTDENARAEGNIEGSYGGDPNPKKARNFIDLTPAELAEIIENTEFAKRKKLKVTVENGDLLVSVDE